MNYRLRVAEKVEILLLGFVAATCRLWQMIHDCLIFLSESWEHRPVVVVLSVVALAVLLFVLIDTHRHRRKFQKRRQDKHQHHR